MRAPLPALLVGLWALGPAAGQAPDPYEARVRTLAHPRYAEREKAARELEAAGEPALKALRAARAAPDEELRARAAAVEARINRAVRSRRLLAAPTLSLKFDKVPLDRAVAELAQKTGLAFQLDRGKEIDANRLVTLDTGEVPFWQAVQAFYAAAGLTEADTPNPKAKTTVMESTGRVTIYTNTPGRTVNQLRLVDGPPAPAATGHALRVRALPAAYPQNRFDPDRDEVTLHLAIEKAPALTLQELIGVEVRRATTPDRQALAPAYPPAAGPPDLGDLLTARQVVVLSGELYVDGAQGGPYFPVTLKTGGDRPRMLAELEGVVVARVLAPPEPLVTVADVFGKGTGQPHVGDGLVCTVTAAEKVAEHPLPLPRVPRDGRDARPEMRPAAGEAPAAVRVQLKWTGDAASEVLNFPVQVRGRPRPFLRIDRSGRRSGLGGAEFLLKDADGQPVRLIGLSGLPPAFDGNTYIQEMRLTFEKPAAGLDGMSLTVTGRRPAVVEMPFVLKDVPLP